MRTRILGCLIAAASLGASTAHPVARADAAGGVTVMTFNIQHGIDGSNKYNLQRAIDTIAKVQPDLVGLQEVTRNHPYYNCDDQPAKIAEGLKAATGRAWSVVYEQEWFTPNVECRDSGRGDGKETEGLVFLSPQPLGSPSMTPLPVSRITLTVKPSALGGMAATVTHLASGKSNGPARMKEVEALLKTTEKFGASQIVLGDFNLKPEEPELQPMLTLFRDAWTMAKEAGVASGPEGTHKDARLDFIFVKGNDVQIVHAESLETSSWFGAAASDHRPVVATLRLPHAVK
jgi:endonuclease/exonuclease/phosphatase family metal-dependent hydrolase